MNAIKLIASGFVGFCVVASVGVVTYYAGKIASNKKLVEEICKICYEK